MVEALDASVDCRSEGGIQLIHAVNSRFDEAMVRDGIARRPRLINGIAKIQV
jgi:hypothetical protein